MSHRDTSRTERTDPSTIEPGAPGDTPEGDDASVDEEVLNELLDTAVVDFGAAWHTALVVVGDRLGLYRTLANEDPLTSTELARQTGTAERYVREWLAAQAAGGYVAYDPETDRYTLTPEQALVLVDEDSPACMLGAFQGAVAGLKVLPRIEEAFQTGEGVGWHEHDHELFHATERLFKPGYEANLVSEWIPALEGVEEALAAGGHVADVGCGYGASTIIMARAFPDSTFVGYDVHEHSVETARSRAAEAGVDDRVRFEVATAKEFDGGDYDLVATFDCLHDMGDPVGAAAHIRDELTDDGVWMIVEPNAGDRVEENLNPVGRAFYAISTMVCTPCSLSQEVGYGLGAQAGEARLREVATDGGFSRFRRVAETPFNVVLEAKP